ncbi:hypothetical protein Hanom_Chr16g01433601 [Helianthus anomalus]
MKMAIKRKPEGLKYIKKSFWMKQANMTKPQRFGTVPVRYGTGSVPVFTGFYPQIPVPVPNRTEPGIFGTGTHF